MLGTKMVELILSYLYLHLSGKELENLVLIMIMNVIRESY